MEQALSLIRQETPDFIILELSLKKGSGFEFIKYIRKKNPDLPILVLSMHNEVYYAERVIRAGANGYLMKEMATEHVINAIRKILNGEIYLSEKMTSLLLSKLASSRKLDKMSHIESLSDRELEIYEMIGQGLSTREIAEKLSLSPKTVETHKENLKRKLKLKNSTELLRHAAQWAMKEFRSS